MRWEYDRARCLVANERERLLSATGTSSGSHVGVTNTTEKKLDFADKTAVSGLVSSAGPELSRPEGIRRQQKFDRISSKYVAGRWAAADGHELLNTSGHRKEDWLEAVETGLGECGASGAFDLSMAPLKSCLKKPVWPRDLTLCAVCVRPMQEVI